MQHIQFKKHTITMAGNLHFPEGFKDGEKYPAIVVIHPAGGVKEQTAGEYAKQLAVEGFVTLAFDASYQGESGGSSRFLDEPMNRVSDIYSAIDYLTTLAFVDNTRIGILGICAGGGYSVKAATLDRRIKAVATASAVNVGNATRKGWDGQSPVSAVQGLLETIATHRTAEAGGAEPAYSPYVPNVGDTNAPRDLREAADYYLTSRGQHPNAPNKMLLTGLSAWAAFDAFDLVDPLLTQPVMIVAGSEAGSLWHSQELYGKAQGEKELFVVDGAAHMDLYDGPGFGAALGKIAPFFKAKL